MGIWFKPGHNLFQELLRLNSLKLCRLESTAKTLYPEVKVEEGLMKEVDSKDEWFRYKFRSHPGVIPFKAVEIPYAVKNAANTILQDKNKVELSDGALKLANYLNSRQMPIEEKVKHEKEVQLRMQFNSNIDIDLNELSDEKKKIIEKARDKRIKEMIHYHLYNWKPIAYDENTCLQYLIGMFGANYSVMLRLFREIQHRDNSFAPKSIFDFGSGLGTTIWAASDVWNSVKEFYCVDNSGPMIDLCELLLKDGNPHKKLPTGIFFKQFLPITRHLHYDIVASQNSLLELPNASSRIETILNLYQKTKKYLILAENGGLAGYHAIIEARDFLLQFQKERSNRTNLHVFAPCPHDNACPKFGVSKHPCNFEVKYAAMKLEGVTYPKPHVHYEQRFSYVIFKKGHYDDRNGWSRIIGPVKKKSQHARCKLCLPQNKVEDIVFTARHGKVALKCVKGSKWGDRLPLYFNVERDSYNENHDIEVGETEEIIDECEEENNSDDKKT